MNQELEMSIICDEAVHLAEEDKKSIIRIVKRHNESAMKGFADGTRIHLPKLSDEIIKQIYDLIVHKLNLKEYSDS